MPEDEQWLPDMDILDVVIQRKETRPALFEPHFAQIAKLLNRKQGCFSVADQ